MGIVQRAKSTAQLQVLFALAYLWLAWRPLLEMTGSLRP